MKLEDRIDAMLDSALEMTFPASDPFTVYFPEVEPDDEAAEAPRDYQCCQPEGDRRASNALERSRRSFDAGSL